MNQATTEGGQPALGFREVWCVDFEFQANGGERPSPVCMVALEILSGREVRMWRDELCRRQCAPFCTGSDSLFVAYYASAELGCFLALGWPMPSCVLDLYAEFRVATNGLPTLCGNGLLGALAHHGLTHIDVAEKDAMRRLVMDRHWWNDTDQRSILDYCATDVYGLAALLPRMAATIDWPRALLRGRYMAAAARMESVGVPMDVPTHTRLADNWSRMKAKLVRAVDRKIGVYDGQTFKADRFAAWLAARNLPWPRLSDGALDLKEDTFKAMAAGYSLHPEVQQLHELRGTLGGMRLTGLQIGLDGRNRCILSAFKSVTGRNQPSNTKSIFGPATWMRGLIKPPDGLGLAYIDFASQEIGIAAALSGDERLIEAYTSGDPYLSFAIGARLAPSDATKDTHKAIRDRCKAIVLGIGYGMGADAMAMSAGIEPVEARDLLRKHHNTYRTFWRWNQDIQDAAQLTGAMHTGFGWTRHVNGAVSNTKRDSSPIKDGYSTRSLMNWPMQAGGADMMRIAAIAATEAGISVCLPVHDAFLIQSPIDDLDSTVDEMQAIMCRAGAAVTGGLAIRAEVDQIVRPPNRYMDKRGMRMWRQVMDLLPTCPQTVATFADQEAGFA